MTRFNKATISKQTAVSPLCLKLLLLCSLLLVLPHIANLKAPFIAISLALLAWRASVFSLPRFSPNRWVLLPLSVALALFILKNFGMSFGREASSSLLIVLLALKLLECRTRRDATATIFVGFFVLITPFLFDQSILLALYSLGVLALLILSLIVNTTGQKSLKKFSLLRLPANLLAQAIPLMLIGFILFPRTIGPLWALPDDATSAVSGISDTINPGQISNLALSSESAFRVTFKGPPPQQKDLYWRGPVFYETDGKTWRHKPSKRATAALKQSENPVSYHYTVIIEPHQQKWLYALDLPMQAINSSVLTEDSQLLLSQKLNRSLSYSLKSSNALNNQLSKALKKRAIALPSSTSQNIINLAQQFRKTSAGDAEVVNKVLNYFNQQNFFYTLNPPLLGDKPNDEFLFKTKQGFCSHYASAFTVLMRAASIPSRLVAGYHGGVNNTIGGFWDIRQADAHVWSEVWLANRGWIRVDPTAAIAPERILNSINLAEQLRSGEVSFKLSQLSGISELTQQAKRLLSTLDYYWHSGILAYGPESQSQVLSNIGINNWQEMVKWLAILSTVLISILFGYLNLQQGPKLDKTQKVFLSLCKRLTKRYGARFPYETASDYFERVTTQNKQLESSLQLLKKQYLSCRYGQGDVQRFIRMVKRFRINRS